MSVTPARVALFVLALALGVGYVFYHFAPSDDAVPTGASTAVTPPEQRATPAAPQQPTNQPEESAEPAPATDGAAEQQAIQPATDDVEPEEAATRGDRVTPSFDILRVEPDGSAVIAGRAGAGAEVEILSEGEVLAKTTASQNGDFAVVLDKPLNAGDHTLTLRTKGANAGTSAESQDVAIVSIPTNGSGQVLAMVQAPGQPSRLISLPTTATVAETSEGTADGTASTAAKAEPDAPAQENAAQQTAVGPSVEAVEIENGMVYIAGRAEPGAKLRAYAGEQLLGDAVSSPDGQFLVEARRDIPTGSHTIRIDALSADGKTVTARAAVPFERDEGENQAAVTQPAPSGERMGGSESAETAGLQTTPGAVIIRRGDSLWRISKRVYGRGTRYSTIYLANQDQIQNPDRIWPGQIFRMPEQTEQGEKADMNQLGDQATQPN